MGPKGRGLLIDGPMGTGKTTSLLYFHKKLKEKGRRSMLKILLHRPGTFCPYLQWCCKGMFVVSVFPLPLLTSFPHTENNPSVVAEFDIVRHILSAPRQEGGMHFLLV